MMVFSTTIGEIQKILQYELKFVTERWVQYGAYLWYLLVPNNRHPCSHFIQRIEGRLYTEMMAGELVSAANRAADAS